MSKGKESSILLISLGDVKHIREQVGCDVEMALVVVERNTKKWRILEHMCGMETIKDWDWLAS